ncbi:hypothetical protein B0T21DRAFT_444370 [Apiosordaria backusii]|uniref:Uncharacterized protein n=1 Tax=Apiosordaria backusii TaxID=314023 RepID=A0AA40BEN4_9PEZI|nr:hypothetical protein B0T21DRAFT_444370 [Apiosordaria backusii]
MCSMHYAYHIVQATESSLGALEGTNLTVDAEGLAATGLLAVFLLFLQLKLSVDPPSDTQGGLLLWEGFKNVISRPHRSKLAGIIASWKFTPPVCAWERCASAAKDKKAEKAAGAGNGEKGQTAQVGGDQDVRRSKDVTKRREQGHRQASVNPPARLGDLSRSESAQKTAGQTAGPHPGCSSFLFHRYFYACSYYGNKRELEGGWWIGGEHFALGNSPLETTTPAESTHTIGSRNGAGFDIIGGSSKSSQPCPFYVAKNETTITALRLLQEHLRQPSHQYPMKQDSSGYFSRVGWRRNVLNLPTE